MRAFAAIVLLAVVLTSALAQESQSISLEWLSLENIIKYINDATGLDFEYGKSNPTNLDSISQDYKNKRDDLIKKDKSSYFTSDVKELTTREKQVEEQMFKMRDQVVQGDHSPLKLEFYEGKKVVEDSKIFDVMHMLPKGAHLHLHTSAAIPIDLMMEFTKEDYVYYSFDENKLQAAPNGFDKPGYESCNTIRKNWSKQGTFDDFLREQIKLTADELKSHESNAIWQKFNVKFSLTGGLTRYDKFYRQGVLAI